MDAISHLLVTYCLNAIWQVPVILAVTALCARLMRRAPAAFPHRLWLAALVLSTLLPLASLDSVITGYSAGLTASEKSQTGSLAPRTNGAHYFSWLGERSYREALMFPPLLTWLLVGVYAAFCAYRLARLAYAWRQTLRFRQRSTPRPLPEPLRQVAAHAAAAFQCPNVPILCSSQTVGPVTVGFRRPVLILPERFFTEISEADFSSAICHELAHVQRHDFALNLLCELWSLPVSLHPATSWMKTRIEQTRELACDEIASAHLADRAAYARSLLSIAKSMCATPVSPASNYALGLFDTNSLEDRIMNLLNKTNPAGKRLRTFLAVTASGLLAATAIAVSAFSLQVAQPSSASANLKPFVGTWTSQFEGETFVTLTLKEEGGKLQGTCKHTVGMKEDDQGRLMHVDKQQMVDKVLDAQVDGNHALVTIGDPQDPEHRVPKFELRVVGADALELRPMHHAENATTTQWWKMTRVPTL